MNIFLLIVVGIMSFGAVPNNESVNNADAINRAIEQCSNKGGGVVTVPAGVFYYRNCVYEVGCYSSS